MHTFHRFLNQISFLFSQLVAVGQFRIFKEPLGFVKLLEWVSRPYQHPYKSRGVCLTPAFILLRIKTDAPKDSVCSFLLPKLHLPFKGGEGLSSLASDQLYSVPEPRLSSSCIWSQEQGRERSSWVLFPAGFHCLPLDSLTCRWSASLPPVLSPKLLRQPIIPSLDLTMGWDTTCLLKHWTRSGRLLPIIWKFSPSQPLWP